METYFFKKIVTSKVISVFSMLTFAITVEKSNFLEAIVEFGVVDSNLHISNLFVLRNITVTSARGIMSICKLEKTSVVCRERTAGS